MGRLHNIFLCRARFVIRIQLWVWSGQEHPNIAYYIQEYLLQCSRAYFNEMLTIRLSSWPTFPSQMLPIKNCEGWNSANNPILIAVIQAKTALTGKKSCWSFCPASRGWRGRGVLASSIIGGLSWRINKQDWQYLHSKRAMERMKLHHFLRHLKASDPNNFTWDGQSWKTCYPSEIK